MTTSATAAFLTNQALQFNALFSDAFMDIFSLMVGQFGRQQSAVSIDVFLAGSDQSIKGIVCHRLTPKTALDIGHGF